MDAAIHHRFKGMSEDADRKRIVGKVEKIAPMQKSHLTITEVTVSDDVIE
jgi:hypothetical protein